MRQMNKKLIKVFSFYLFVALGNKKIKISQGSEELATRKFQALAFAFAKADGILRRSINITSDENQVTRAPSTTSWSPFLPEEGFLRHLPHLWWQGDYRV